MSVPALALAPVLIDTGTGASPRPLGTQLLDPATGQVLRTLDTDTLPDKVLYVPCGDRRASVCPACAETYRADTYQLIAAGMRGGKGVPETVAGHPTLFVTLTAPSFGAVHTRRTTSGSHGLPCR